MPTDSKFVLCPVCNQKFRFQYEANKHVQEMHPSQEK